jgi:hypothetical protein
VRKKVPVIHFGKGDRKEAIARRHLSRFKEPEGVVCIGIAQARLRKLGRHINHRLLSLERVAHHCAIASRTVERIVRPTVDDDQRALSTPA